MIRAHLDKAPRDVAAMFDQVAARYDRTNDVLALGLNRSWRRRAYDALAPEPGQRVLDIAAGTGTSSLPFHEAGVHVVAADFSIGMLRQGRAQTRADHPDLPFVAADAMRLPFADDSFDGVTMSFGLRNVADTGAAIAEFLRVTRPGGRLVICEFSTPVSPLVGRGYRDVVLRALPGVARRVSSNPDSYVYLAESIRAWPRQDNLARTIAAAGWADVEWRDLTAGIVALHRAVKPAGTTPSQVVRVA